MIKATGKMKISYLRKLANTGKTFVIGGYCWDKDDHAQLNIGFTAWGNTAKVISENAMVGSVLVFHDAAVKNSNPYDKTKGDENKEREIILNDFSLDSIEQFDESSRKFVTVWEKGNSEKPMKTPKFNQREEKTEQPKQGVLSITEDDFPFN